MKILKCGKTGKRDQNFTQNLYSNPLSTYAAIENGTSATERIKKCKLNYKSLDSPKVIVFR